jgi:GTP cyclohydrolase II
MKNFLDALLILLCCFHSVNFYADESVGNYANTIEKIILYKNDKFKVFYGGPIESPQKQDSSKPCGIQWVMPVIFEDEYYQTRAVYEMAFINCTIEDAKDAEILFVKASDIDIKFKNLLTPDYKNFTALLQGEYINSKYIVVRLADVSNVYYPQIFFSDDPHFNKEDQRKIVNFLHHNFETKNEFKELPNTKKKQEIISENDLEILYQPQPLKITFNGEIKSFYVTKRVLKKDMWRLYYVISKNPFDGTVNRLIEEPVLLRLDSGCVSGQVYNDCSCDCLDQLHDALKQLSTDTSEGSLIIHIPMHDGRGYGTAPKAETEIYKRGGKGRVNRTHPLDTISAANLLYRSQKIDLRTFDGAAKILEIMKVKKVLLLTDNVAKYNALKDNNIDVIRKKTETFKETCKIHIDSKKNSSGYFDD